MIKLGNITMTSEGATVQDAFALWVNSKKAELAGPDGEMPPAEEVEAHLWREIRKLRQELLADTDYMFMSDYPEVPARKVIEYRKKLRDIPQDFNSPEDVAFPIIPKEATK